MGTKCYLSDFDCGMIVGARQGGLNISETADLLGFPCTTVRICDFVVSVSPFVSPCACQSLVFPILCISALFHYFISLIVWFPRFSTLLPRYPSLSVLFKPHCFSLSVLDCNVFMPFFPVFHLRDFPVSPVLCTLTFDFGFCFLFYFDPLFLDPALFLDFRFWILCVFLFWLDL